MAKRSLETAAAHVGEGVVSAATRPVSMPIYQTSVFAFPDLDTVEAVYTGGSDAFLYSRMAHPNGGALEEAMAELEGGEAGLAAASGMAVIHNVLSSLLGPGDHAVVTAECYGGTYALFEHYLRRYGVTVTYVATAVAGTVAEAIHPSTRVVYVESIANPTTRVADVPALAKLCQERGLTLVVDNTFATPYLFRPLAHGAHVSLSSATKFLAGHSDVTAGVAAGSREYIAGARSHQVITGATIDPFAAWLTLRGIKTLAVRVRRHSANALQLARFLAGHPRVEKVHYPGLESHPDHALAGKLLPLGSGGMLSFVVEGGMAAANRFIRALKLCQFVPSLGDVGTTVSHPALTSHRAMTEEARVRLGITGGMVRVSVGIEAPDDILADFEQALSAV